MKRFVFITIIFSFFLYAKENTKNLKIGVSPFPNAKLLNIVKESLKKDGIKMEIVEMYNYDSSNLALLDGTIDAHFILEENRLKQWNSNNPGKEFVSLGRIYLEPVCLYSSKYKTIEEIPKNSSIILPADYVSRSRALKLLDSLNLLVINETTDFPLKKSDIISNPKNLKIIYADASEIPYLLNSTACVVINGSIALEHGINPLKNSLFYEHSDNSYGNVFVVKKDIKNIENLKKVYKTLTTEKVKKILTKEYKGVFIPLF